MAIVEKNKLLSRRITLPYKPDGQKSLNNVLDYERVKAREKLAETEKILSGILYERGVNDKDFAIIRSKGDLSTATLKRKLSVPDNHPPAEDIKKVERKLKNDEKIIEKTPRRLPKGK